MTPEQRMARARMLARNIQPIKIYTGTDNDDVDWFRYHVARASGRIGEYWKPRMRWYFWHHTSARYISENEFFLPASEHLYTFRTFRAACDKVRELLKDGV